MPKITIKVTLITPELTDEKTYNAIYHPEENSIIYKEEDKTTTKVSLNKTLELNLKAKKINQVDKNIEINYVLENDEYKYKLEVI